MQAEAITTELDEKVPPALEPGAVGGDELAKEFSAAEQPKATTEAPAEPRPEYAEAIRFLRMFHPARRWVLTGISLDKKLRPTDTFTEASADRCLQWLEMHGRDKNIYFSVGEIPRDVKKKADREDIARVWWLHVDVDPRAGEDIVGIGSSSRA